MSPVATEQPPRTTLSSPERVREDMKGLVATSGCNYVLCSFAWGTLAPQQSLRSLRLFADEVMPAFAAG